MEKSANDKQAGGSKQCPQDNPKCKNPKCDGQDPLERGPGTRRNLSEFKEGNGCPQFEPKLIGTVNMGQNATIDLKIARTGVPGNAVRTDFAASMLKYHLDQPLLDRHALRILR